MNQGNWLKLYRSITKNELWLSEPFTKAQAWIDILCMVNYETGKVRISQDKLSKRWQWKKSKVRYFLDYLKAEGMVNAEHSTANNPKSRTEISVLQWDFYQSNDAGNSAKKNAKNSTAYNNKKNKEVKNKIPEGIPQKPEWMLDEDWEMSQRSQST